jgi:peroxiredoxin
MATWTRRDMLAWTAALAVAGRTTSARQTPLDQLPPNLPVPQDDGGCRHLVGMRLPDLELPSTRNRRVNLSKVTARRVVVYAYPMTGRPGVTLPAGWDDIPGARGCTLETCGFRDHHADLGKLQTEVYGVSVQTTGYQQEMVERLKVPFEVLSDAEMALVRALKLPTFTAGGMTLIKRLTIVATAGRIEHVFYPVFPPDKHAEEVIAWLKAHSTA